MLIYSINGRGEGGNKVVLEKVESREIENFLEKEKIRSEISGEQIAPKKDFLKCI